MGTSQLEFVILIRKQSSFDTFIMIKMEKMEFLDV